MFCFSLDVSIFSPSLLPFVKSEFTYGSGGVSNPAAQNINAGSKDINQVTVVAEPSTSVGNIGSTNCANSRLTGRAVIVGVVVAVSSSHGHEDAGLDSGGNSTVDGSRAGAAKREVGYAPVGAVAGLGVGGNKVDTGDDSSEGPGARGTEDLDGIELGCLGNAKVSTADGTGDVGAVAVPVGVVGIGKVGEPLSTASELLMAG